jgi:hypothetical protein
LVREKEKYTICLGTDQYNHIDNIRLNRTSFSSTWEFKFLLDVGNIQAVGDFQYTQNVFNNLLYEFCFIPDHDYDSYGKHNNEVIKYDKERRSKKKKKPSKLYESSGYQTNVMLLSFDKHLTYIKFVKNIIEVHLYIISVLYIYIYIYIK